MTHAWVERMNKAHAKKFKKYPQALVDAWEAIPEEYRQITDPGTGSLADTITKIKDDLAAGNPVDVQNIHWLYNKSDVIWLSLYFKQDKDKIEKAGPYYESLSKKAFDYWFYMDSPDFYSDLEDKVMEFNGDVIITDPCYLDVNVEDRIHDGYYPENMADFGIKGIYSDTFYGDWSCTTYDKLKNKPIGEFCADGGMVCVCDLATVLKFNPKFDYHTLKPWTTTLIKNFKGTARIKIAENKKSKFPTYIVTVEGDGINSVTGEPIVFYTKQDEEEE